jgi:hypothetical protein
VNRDIDTPDSLDPEGTFRINAPPTTEPVHGSRLRLSGYDVFRFGAIELQDKSTARKMLQPFFDDLFRLFDVTILHNDSTPAG